jgi:hypothetical protein
MNKEIKHLNKLVLVILVALIAGCSLANNAPQDNRVSITGSGNMVSHQIDVSGFEKIETGFAFNVAIHQGQEFSVVASVDDNLAEYLYVEKVGTALKIGLKPGYAYDIPQATMRAEVIMPELVGLDLNGSSHATLTGFDSLEDFSAELSGSSSLSGEIQAESANLNAFGSTFVKLSGKGSDLSVDACGSGTVDLGDYRVEDAALQVACASTVIINVDRSLDVNAAQNAQVYFTGHPAVSDLNVHEYAFVGPK